MQGPEEYPAIGIAELDDEHRLLAADLRDLLAAVKEDDPDRCRVLAHTLVDRAAAHFRHEERLMREVHFAFQAQHQRAHELFLEQARRHLEELQAIGLSLSCLRWIAETLEWFRSHVVKEDMALARAIRAVRAGPG
jgi:hemerythrin-like metal-binding protein